LRGLDPLSEVFEERGLQAICVSRSVYLRFRHRDLTRFRSTSIPLMTCFSYLPIDKIAKHDLNREERDSLT